MPIHASGKVEAVDHMVSKQGAERPYDYHRLTLDDGRGTIKIRLNDECELPVVGQRVSVEVGPRPYKDDFDGQLHVAYRGYSLDVVDAAALRVAS